MKNSVLWILVTILVLCGSIFGQQNSDPDSKPPGYERKKARQQMAWEAEQARRREANRRRLAPIIYDPETTKRDPNLPIPPRRFYKIGESSELNALIDPDVRDQLIYETFLKRKKTGLVKLLPYSGCGTSLIVNVRDRKCGILAGLPGFGSYFSFESRNYSFGKFADIRYSNEKFESSFNPNSLGVLSNLGNLPLEQLTSKNLDVKNLVANGVPRYEKDLERNRRSAKTGMRIGRRMFYDSRLARFRNTYILRSVSYDIRNYNYNGRVARQRGSDVVVVFRVVRFGIDGSVTILWKRLKKSRAPKIRA